jgi:hypothetical protein
MLAAALAGCAAESEPFEWPDDPSPSALGPSPSSSANSAEAEAVDEIISVFHGFREVETEVYADPPPPYVVRRDLSPYLADPMLSETVVTLDEMRKAGVAFEGRSVSEPAVDELRLDATPATATVRDCVDATEWRSVFQDTGELVPGDSLPGQYVMRLEATLYPEHGWLFHDFTIEEDAPC